MAEDSRDAREQVLGLLAAGIQLALAAERHGLGERLRAARQRLNDHAVEVLVAGAHKQGKSSLINALLGADICPVAPIESTAVPTFIRYGPRVSATVYRRDDEDSQPIGTALALAELDRVVLEREDALSAARVIGVDVTLPNELLGKGLVLVDAPGVGGVNSAHHAATAAALPLVDALLFVTDASGELTTDELDFLKLASDVCPKVLCALTKIDFYYQWRLIANRDEMLLRKANLRIPVLPISATLRSELGSESPESESGYPALLSVLNKEVIDPAGRRAYHWSLMALSSATSELDMRLRDEAKLLAEADAPGAIEDLEAARSTAEAVRAHVTQWQQRLADGLSDMAADLEHDLRARLRSLGQEADRAIDSSDPAVVWEQLDAWVQQGVGRELSAHFASLTRRVRSLVEEIAADLDSATFTPSLPETGQTSMPPKGRIGPRPEQPAILDQALSAIRSSYGGIWVLGGMGSMVLGLATLNPLSVGGGVLLGAHAVREERRRQLTQRRHLAKAAIRAYLDEVAFSAAKESRDTLRLVQRSVRDAYAMTSRQAIQAVQDQLQRMQETLTTEQSKRAARAKQVRALLLQVDDLNAKLAPLLTHPQSP